MVYRRLRPPDDGSPTQLRETVYILPAQDFVHARPPHFHSRFAHLRGLSNIRDIHTRQNSLWRCRCGYLCRWDGDRSASCAIEEDCAVCKFAELDVWSGCFEWTAPWRSVYWEQEVDLEILLLAEFA